MYGKFTLLTLQLLQQVVHITNIDAYLFTEYRKSQYL